MMSDVAEYPAVTDAVRTVRSPAPAARKFSSLVTDSLRSRHARRAGSILVKNRVEADTGGSRVGRPFQRFALACATFALANCIVAAPKEHADKSSGAVRAAAQTVAIVVITLDGVRWQEVFEGVDAKLAAAHDLAPEQVVPARRLLPNLYAIIDGHGAALGAPGYGAPISASGPNFLSLPGYAELFSGRTVTGCDDNQCRGISAHTIIEELSAGTHADAGEVAAVTSWPEIAKVTSYAGADAAVSSGRHGGSHREAFARDAEGARLLALAENAPHGLGDPDFRADSLTADIAIHHLKAHAPRFLFLGLGEPDEFAHMNDYGGYLAALRRADARLGELDAELQRLAQRGTRTALFVTADHGRADGFVNHGGAYPESARVWLVAAGSAFQGRGFVAAPSGRRLADIAPTVREIAHLKRDSDRAAGVPLMELLGTSTL